LLGSNQKVPIQTETIPTRETALAWATHLVEAKTGVIAWAKSGDPDTGAWDVEPEILFKAGRVLERVGDEGE
jgi:hypothetical protein